MKLKDILKDVINESPDNVDVDGRNISYHEKGNVPFAQYNGKTYVGDEGSGHSQLSVVVMNDQNLSFPPNSWGNTGDSLKYQGRLFGIRKEKIITMWKMPDKTTFIKIIKDVEKAWGKQIFGNGWRVESDPWERDDVDRYTDLDEYVHYKKWKKFNMSSELRQHMQSPMEKKRREVPKGIGSEKDIPGAKKGESPVQTKYRLRNK